MPAPAKAKWWDRVLRNGDTVELEDSGGQGRGVHLLWGDRVRVLEVDAAGERTKVYARGTSGWVPTGALGDEALLEVYFIDVGQGDGILVVTPEGHHLMVDGGHMRARQQTGKSAADFVDWKFHKEYLTAAEREVAANNRIQLDAMVASHADEDHYGGLRDLVDPRIEVEADELDCADVTVEAFYHPGLCPQRGGTDDLGPKEDGAFVSLLEDRASALDGIQDQPAGALAIRGRWRDFVEALTAQTTAAGVPTPIVRLSHETGHLPHFAPGESSQVAIRVLAPITTRRGGRPALLDLGDEGENKNGHSVALRLDYRERRILLTGDLNDRSQAAILEHHGDDFASEWGCDVAKACHHGSHHVDFRFLQGLGALSTVFSSGDANTYDHPRAWVLGAAALAGRVVEDPAKPRLRAPLIYSTEVARSLALKSVDQLRRYDEVQHWGRERAEPAQTVSGAVTTSKWRVTLERGSSESRDNQPLAAVKVMRNIVYGLVNVRTDGHRLLFAVRNEESQRWALETLEPDEIAGAWRVQRAPPA